MLTEYRSLVGKILFATRKSYPEIANAVRELTGHFDNPNQDHWKALGRLIGYLKFTAIHGLKFNVPGNMELIGFVDTDYAANKDTRKSTTGYLLTLGGCLVSWMSKAQSNIALSSTEAEYVGASTLGTEMKFIMMLLEELHIDFPKPTTMCEDNTGAIFLMQNDQIGQRTKHIDIKWHHIRDMVREGEIQIVYIRSEENPSSDIMTKNCQESIFTKHTEKIKKGILVDAWNREDVVRYESSDLAKAEE